MIRHKALFNSKQCELCSRTLAPDYENTMCPQCLEQELFSKVKEFIRTYDVTEYDVAEKFQIPVRKVKEWIKEGRIEYKEDKTARKKFDTMRCTKCGELISFGSVCSKCIRKASKSGTAVINPLQDKKSNSKMRYLDTEEK